VDRYTRVPVQGDGPHHLQEDHPARRAYRGIVKPPGTIAWWEHLNAGEEYNRRGFDQTARRIMERGGFSHAELVDLLGHAPETWEPRT